MIHHTKRRLFDQDFLFGGAVVSILIFAQIGGQQMTMGKIMILSGSSTQGLGWDLINSPGGLRITNPHTGFDVGLKVLLVN
jgi:hypothetical protein